jgi:hypothetical protein
MQVQYRETKSGFECIHAPSIDLSSVQTNQLSSSRRHTHQGSSGSADDGIRRSLTKKVSKLSFAALKGKEKEKDVQQDPLPTPRTDGASARSEFTTSTSNGSSLFNVSSNAHTIKPERSMNGATSDLPLDSTRQQQQGQGSPNAKTLPPIPRDYAEVPPQSPGPNSALPSGLVDKNVFDEIGRNSLCVKFEINIVKVRSICFTPFRLFV